MVCYRKASFSRRLCEPDQRVFVPSPRRAQRKRPKRSWWPNHLGAFFGGQRVDFKSRIADDFFGGAFGFRHRAAEPFLGDFAGFKDGFLAVGVKAVPPVEIGLNGELGRAVIGDGQILADLVNLAGHRGRHAGGRAFHGAVLNGHIHFRRADQSGGRAESLQGDGVAGAVGAHRQPFKVLGAVQRMLVVPHLNEAVVDPEKVFHALLVELGVKNIRRAGVQKLFRRGQVDEQERQVEHSAAGTMPPHL